MAGNSDSKKSSTVSTAARMAKKSTLTFVTFVFLLATAGGYYLHVSDQESYLISRNFRLLALWSKELTAKVSDYKNHFQYIISASEPMTDAYEDWDCSQGSPIKVGLDGLKDTNTETRCPEKSSRARSFEELVESMGIKPKLTLVPEELTEKTVFDDFAQFSTQLRSNDVLRFKYKEISGSGMWKFAAELSFHELVDLIVTEEIFDDIIIFDSTGKVYFQQNPSQFKIDNIHNLITAEAQTGFFEGLFSEDSQIPLTHQAAAESSKPSPGSSLPHPTHRRITAGSISYELFTQPVLLPNFTLSKQENKEAPQPRLILAGLVTSSTFQSRAYAIPYTWLLIFIFFVLFGFLSLPIVRLSLMDHRERLTPFNVISLLLTSLVGTALLTVFCLDAAVFIKTRESLNNQLTISAQEIKNRFNEELSAILAQLNRYNNSQSLKNDFAFTRKPQFDWVARKQITSPCDSTPISLSAKWCYPTYDVAFWIDPDKKVKINWTRGSTPYLQGGDVSLGHRDYVNNVLNPERPLLRKTIEGTPLQFYAQPLISLGSGKRSVVVSMPFSPPPAHTEPRDNSKTWVAAIEQSFQSFISTAIPAGTGFAVIDDESGDVLFHTDVSRSLRENFFEETDNNAELLAHVQSRTGGGFEGEYLGIGHAFYSLPLSDVPWSVVVFRNKDLFRTVNFEALLLASALFALYALIFFSLAGWRLYSRLRHEKAPWFWPDYHQPTWYAVIIVLNVFHLFLGICLFRFIIPTNYFLLFGLIYPLISLLLLRIEMGVLMQCWERPSRTLIKIGIEDVPPKYIHRLYAGVITSFLFLLSALPMGVFFKIGIEQEMTLAIKYNLVSLGREILKSSELDLSPIRYELNQAQATPTALLNEATCPPSSGTDGNTQSLTGKTQTTNPSNSSRVFSHSKHGSHLSLFTKTTWCMAEKPWNPQSVQVDSPVNPDAADLPFVKLIHRYIRSRALLSPISIETYGLIDDRPWDKTFAWPPSVNSESPSVVLAFQMPVKGITTETKTRTSPWVILRSFFPVHNWFLIETHAPHSPWGNLLWYFWMLVYLGAVTFLPTFIISKIFPIPWKSANSRVLQDPERTKHPLEKRNFLILGLPGSGKSDLAHNFPTEQWKSIDLHLAGDTEKWKELKEQALKSGKPGIILDHFEYQFGVPKFDQPKRELLEALLANGKEICVLSTINPFKFQLDQDKTNGTSDEQKNSTAASFGIWSQAFQSFTLMYHESLSDLDCEDKLKKEPQIPILLNEGSPNKRLSALAQWVIKHNVWKEWSPFQVVSSFRILAKPYYEAIWQSRTEDEKITLFNIARDRFVHAANPDLLPLLKLGLVKFQPHLRLINDSFQEYVLIAAQREDIETKSRIKRGQWNTMKWPLFAGFSVLAIGLLLTQQEIKNSFGAMISLLPILLPAFSELTGVLQKDTDTPQE